MTSCGKEPRNSILIYSDEFVLGVGASDVLSAVSHFDVTLAESDLSSLIPLAMQVRPHVILLDSTAGMTLQFVAALRIAVPAARIVLWARQFSEELASQSHELGGIWFLRHGLSKDEFILCVSNICNGAEPPPRQSSAGARKVELTPREAQLVTLLAQGLSNKSIASCLGITEGTVRIYLSKLFVKVGAKHRLELAVFGLKNLTCGQAFWDGPGNPDDKMDQTRARPVLRSLFLVEPTRRTGYPQLTEAAAG